MVEEDIINMLSNSDDQNKMLLNHTNKEINEFSAESGSYYYQLQYLANYLSNYIISEDPNSRSKINVLEFYYGNTVFPNNAISVYIDNNKLSSPNINRSEIEEALENIDIEDILTESFLTDLGTRNSNFINSNESLRKAVEDYFIANDYSQSSHDGINYVLNQYLDGHQLVVVKKNDYYEK